MTYRGRVQNGVVVLEDPTGIPEGTEVTVRPVKPRKKPVKGKQRPGGLRPGVMKFAGIAKDLPEDAAKNLDHYLYGHPKR